jgi:formylglycine-generating enzyme required for sulfatase activity
LSSEQANFDGNYPYGAAESGQYIDGTCPVGSYQPNAWGLYDLHGQVWEWCHDWYSRTYYQRSPRQDPTGPRRGESRIIRGGGWYDRAQDCRSAYRNRLSPDQRGWHFGFRAACVLG